jgi:hypothetical protein
MTVCSPSFTARRLGAALLIALLPLAASPAWGQAPPPTGKIAGRVIDAKTGVGLSEVGVQVVGTTKGTMSGFDGRYTITGLEGGTVSLHVRRIGYQPKTITGIFLTAGASLEQNVSLEEAAIELTPTVVTASAERGSVAAALDAQRTATGVVNSVTSEQISRSPDSDAAQAVQRVSGVTVQDGKFVFVRGLGERYTTTSLNGARLPSPEPERKVVPLDLFPASLLQSVTTSKTFTPDQPGDFSGAQVDLRTREFPAERQVHYSISVGHNSQVTGKEVATAPTTGLEWLGFGAGDRALPGIVQDAGDFSQSPTQAEYNAMVGSLRNAWSVRQRTGTPNSSMSVSVGGNDPFLGRQIGYIGSLTYSYNQEIRADELRAFALVDPGAPQQTAEIDRYEGSTGRSSVLWGGLLNVSTLVGDNSRISLNNTYTRSADNEARYEEGNDAAAGIPLQVSRLRYVERSVRSSQLTGEHEFGQTRLDWAVTAAGVTRVEPDRSESVYAIDETGGTPFLLNAGEAAVRTFGDLVENSYSGSVDYTIRFDRGERQHSLKVGLLGRYTRRDAENTSYSINAPSLSREEREHAPEEIFDGRHTQPGSAVFSLVPLNQGGSYEAEDVLGAGYVMGDYQIASRARLIAGARVEHSMLDLTTYALFLNPMNVEPTYTDVLPAVALNIGLTENQNLRLSISQTLARPEYRELADVCQHEVLGGEEFCGNSNLKRTLIQNADLRWELYPAVGEVISVGVFAKRFDDPIERIYRGTSGTRRTEFDNASSALNFGAELELRKGLGFVGAALEPLSVFSNVTVMSSEIDLANVSAGSTDANRAMVGQAPYVVNAGLGYTSAGGGASVTALYNIVGRRIFAAALSPLPNVYEEARNVIDLSARFPMWGDVALKLDAKNLLDAPYEVTQGSVTREYYRAGRSLSAGVTWRP